MSEKFEGLNGLETPTTGLKKSSSLDVKKVENSIDKGIQDRKINDVLNKVDKSEDIEEGYRQKLEKLDADSLEQLSKLDNTSLETLLEKSIVEIQINLIQAQIKEIEDKENLTKEDKKERYLLKKKLIAVEKAETQANEETIASELKETTEVEKTEKKIEELRDALSNPKIQNNPKIKEIEAKFKDFFSVEKSNDTEREKIVSDIIQYLKDAGTLESIAQDLGGVESEEYQKLKSNLISIDESFRPIFDRVELGSTKGLAMIKLGVNDLEGIEYLTTDTIVKKEDDLVIEATKDTRSLSLEGSDYKFETRRDNKKEEELEKINTDVNNEQKPLNETLNKIDDVLKFISESEANNVDFNDFKDELKARNPILYNELGLENINSYEEVNSVLNIKKTELEKQKEEIIKKGEAKIKDLVNKDLKELKEQDIKKKETLKFLNSIGFDRLKQSESNIVIESINRYPANYGLDKEIDFESGSIGFDKDRGNSNISMQEKIAFVELFNKMLGEDIIRVDKELQKIIPLTMVEESKIQELSNKRAGFFTSNLDKN